MLTVQHWQSKIITIYIQPCITKHSHLHFYQYKQQQKKTVQNPKIIYLLFRYSYIYIFYFEPFFSLSIILIKIQKTVDPHLLGGVWRQHETKSDVRWTWSKKQISRSLSIVILYKVHKYIRIFVGNTTSCYAQFVHLWY